MPSIFKLLERIRHAPSLYIGGPDGHIVQLRRLEMVLHGYQLALHEHGLREDVADFMREFGAFLQHKHGWPSDSGGITAVIESTTSPEGAWETFWNEVASFELSQKTS